MENLSTVGAVILCLFFVYTFITKREIVFTTSMPKEHAVISFLLGTGTLIMVFFFGGIDFSILSIVGIYSLPLLFFLICNLRKE